jgi:beta-lactamase class D
VEQIRFLAQLAHQSLPDRITPFALNLAMTGSANAPKREQLGRARGPGRIPLKPAYWVPHLRA